MIYPVDDMIQTPMLQTHNAKHRKKGRSLNSTCNAGRQNAKPHRSRMERVSLHASKKNCDEKLDTAIVAKGIAALVLQ